MSPVTPDTLPQTWLIPVIVIGVIVQFLWSSIVSIVLFKLSKTDRNYEAIESRLTETNDKLIAERFRLVTHSVANHAQQFTGSLDLMALHVKERDREFAKLFEANPHQELRLAKELNALRIEVRDSTCSAKDFTDLRDEHREMKDQLGRIATIDDMRKLLQENRHG